MVIHATPGAASGEHIARALQRGISIGNDTDTVAAIADALLGRAAARYDCLLTGSDGFTAGPDGMPARGLIRMSLAEGDIGSGQRTDQGRSGPLACDWDGGRPH